jgi:histone H3/H4
MSETETAAGSLVVKSKAKKKLKELGLNTAKDALEGLDRVVSEYLERAASRASENGRKTVRSHDF